MTKALRAPGTRRWGLALILLGLAVVLALAGCATRATGQAAASISPLSQPTAGLQPAIITPAELEERFGIQMTLLAVTAAGGLVDIRFRITDAAKAADLFRPENLPTVIVSDRGVSIRPPEQPQPGQLTNGQIYYLLYPNSGGAVRPGSRVFLAFGDVGLEYQTAP